MANALVPRLARRTVYVLSELPLAVARFVVLMVMFVVGIVTAPTVLGLPVLATALRVGRGFADLDRRRLSRMQGWPARRPAYRTGEGRGWFRRSIVPLGQAQSWADWGHGVLGVLLVIPAFVITVAWWAVVAALLLSFTYVWAIPRGRNYESIAELLRVGEGWGADAAVLTIGGVVLAATLPAVVRGCAAVVAGPARGMLTSDRVAELHEQVSDLTESRDAAVSAEAGALRRLERDIHDGPQQRLVRLAMDLSAAQRRLGKDPAAVEPMLAEAIRQTRETLDELRALSRGIAPPVLADRGLRSALAAVAGRCTVPVDLDVDLPDGVRLPEMVENTAYFVVAEALTNVAKHSAADHCSVLVTRAGTLARVNVTDNGVGGANTAKGHGLAGLADRVRAAGGRFALESPSGGPTVLTVELPCES